MVAAMERVNALYARNPFMAPGRHCLAPMAVLGMSPEALATWRVSARAAGYLE